MVVLAYINLNMQKSYFQNNTDPISRSTTITTVLPYLVSSVPATDRIQLGYDLGTVLLHCTFNGKTCDKYLFAIQAFKVMICILANVCVRSDFVEWIDPVNGNCFTFNHIQGAHFRTDYAGGKHGMKILFIRQTMYYNSKVACQLIKQICNRPQIRPCDNDRLFPMFG